MEVIEKNTIQILDKALKEGFTQLPRLVLKAKGLSMQAKTLYALLLDYAWRDESCFPGQDRLANDLSVHKNTILKYLNELKSFGLISWVQRGLNKTNIYYINSLNYLYEKNIGEILESQSSVNPESQEDRTQELQGNVNIIETELQDSEEYKQTISNIGDKKFEKSKILHTELFDQEAIFLSEELKDHKGLPFYQSIIKRRNSGEISDNQIQKALTLVKDKLAVDKADGTNFWRNPGAMFNSTLQKIIRKDKSKSIDIAALAQSKTISSNERKEGTYENLNTS